MSNYQKNLPVLVWGNVAKYAVFVALVEWCRTLPWTRPDDWASVAFRWIAWAGLFASIAIALSLLISTVFLDWYFGRKS